MLRLDIRGLPQVTDGGLIAVAMHCPLLKKLCIASTYIGDAGLQSVAQHCRYLEMLDLKFNSTFTSKALVDISIKCTNLHLVLVSADNIIINELARSMWQQINPKIEFSTDYGLVLFDAMYE